MPSDYQLAKALRDAELAEDVDGVLYAENDILARLNVSPEETEQGMTRAAADKVDAFLRLHLGEPIRGIS
jgi:phytoene/squalene synthetase